MYQWTNSHGQTIKTETIADFSRMTGIRYSNAKSLACGLHHTLHGWLSPKAPKKRRQRFNTVLKNIWTHEDTIVGKSVTSFARAHGLSTANLHRVLLGKKLCYKGWCLGNTVKHTRQPMGQNLAPSVKRHTISRPPHDSDALAVPWKLSNGPCSEHQ